MDIIYTPGPNDRKSPPCAALSRLLSSAIYKRNAPLAVVHPADAAKLRRELPIFLRISVLYLVRRLVIAQTARFSPFRILPAPFLFPELRCDPFPMR